MAAFFLNAHFAQDDYPYDWHAHSALYFFQLLTPLQVGALALQGLYCRLVSVQGALNTLQQPAWGRSREFDNTTQSVRRNGATQSTAGDVNSKPDVKMQFEKG